jgi:hypothetical protein
MVFEYSDDRTNQIPAVFAAAATAAAAEAGLRGSSK